MNNKVKQLLRILSRLRKNAIMKRDIPFIYLRFLAWQIRIRFNKSKKIINWVNNLKLEVYPHRSVATGNYYLGLMEFPEMAFCMHYLRKNEMLYDIGANIGDYAILAAGVSEAKVVAVEPILETVDLLKNNILQNNLGELVKIERCAVGSLEGYVTFCNDRDSENRRALNGDREATEDVPVKRLDTLFEENGIADVIKIDVEGYESDVLLSAGDKIKNEKINVIIAELLDSEVIAQIKELGFDMYQYNPLERRLSKPNEEKLRNGIFIKDIELAKSRIESTKPFIINGMRI